MTRFRGASTAGGNIAAGPFGDTNPYPVTQAYGWVNPDHSVGPNGYSFHYGLDIGAPEGAPLVSMGYGTVIWCGDNVDATGFSVFITYDDGTQLQYYHMRDASLVRPGATVTPGQTVGYVGATGNATGPHLHLGIYLKNPDGSTYTVDPLPFLAACNPVEYVPPAAYTGPSAIMEYVGTTENWWTHRWKIRMVRRQLGAWQGTSYQGVQDGQDVWFFDAEDW